MMTIWPKEAPKSQIFNMSVALIHAVLNTSLSYILCVAIITIWVNLITLDQKRYQ